MIASQKEVTLANLPENSAEWRTMSAWITALSGQAD